MKVSNAALLPEVVAMIDSGHTVTLTLHGYSMRPFLEDGRDKALLSSPAGIGEGDVALAEIKPSVYVLHRIVAISGDNVTLRGDGNIANEYCKLTDLKAKAIGFYRRGSDTLDSVESNKWKLYSWLWTRLYPIRRYLLFAYRHLHLYKL